MSAHQSSIAAARSRRARRAPRSRIAMVLVVGVIVGAGAGTVSALIAGSARRTAVSPSALLVHPARRGQRISFTLLLRIPGSRRAQSALAGLENPGSRSFRHFIAPASFGARFGISSRRLRSLENRLRVQGVRPEATYPQRTQLGASATVATVERLFHVRILSYDSSGHSFHAPAAKPTVPATLRAEVDGVSGLDTRPQMHPRDVPSGGLTPTTAPVAYDIAALHNLGITGQGQTIAVVSFSAFDPSDATAFAQRYGITGPPPVVVPVDGGTTDTSGQSEANLDIDVIRAIAPSAQVLIYEAPQSTSSYSDLINQIVASRRTQIISSSWGKCELRVAPDERAGDTRALAVAVASGVSMFVASGDSGAYDCQQDDLSDHLLSVDWPASSADAIAVGGTRLYLGADDSYQREAAWEDQLSDGGGGGGMSTGDARPRWQAGVGVLDRYSNGRRQVPDVSADADPGTPWAFYSEGQLFAAGGTSAAAPFWAASTLLIEQYAARQGVGRVGFVDPILYALAAAPRPYPAFHDVTLGTNRYYQTALGWDPATGLGSPDVYNLARDVVAYLRSHGR